jgi:hypothetical protein
VDCRQQLHLSPSRKELRAELTVLRLARPWCPCRTMLGETRSTGEPSSSVEAGADGESLGDDILVWHAAASLWKPDGLTGRSGSNSAASLSATSASINSDE